MKMNFCSIVTFIVALKIIGGHSTLKIPVQINESLTDAAVSIVEKCFASPERWSMLLIISKTITGGILERIHQEPNGLNLIISLDTIEQATWKRYDPSNKSLEYQELKPTAVLISIHNAQQLESVLKFYKSNVLKLWNARSYLLIVLEGKCNVTEGNNMLKVVWTYWIINAIILCSTNDPDVQNENELELYTFNPYSVDHSREWKLSIHDTVPVYVNPGDLTHSWYIFQRTFTGIKSSEDCDEIFFDKTFNLEGYVIPFSAGAAELFTAGSMAKMPKWYDDDWVKMKMITRKLRCVMSMVLYKYQPVLEKPLVNGSSCAVERDHWRSQPAPISVPENLHPRLGTAHSSPQGGMCFISRIVGPRPQWSNIADAKSIWIGIGITILFVTIAFYLQNKSQGIVSAFLDSERLVTGSSVIHTSANLKYRIILGSILLVTLVVDGSIRGRFISTLTVVKQYPNFDTVEQLKQQNVKLYGDILFQKIFINTSMESLYSNKYSALECLQIIERQHHQQACLVSCKSLPYLTWNLTATYASKPVVSQYVWPISTLHTAFLDHYHMEVLRVSEAGLVPKFQEDLYIIDGVSSWKLKNAAKPTTVKPTKLNDLLPIFFLLFLGLSAALIRFGWETRGSWYFARISVRRENRHGG